MFEFRSINIGFDFSFNGVTYNSVNAYHNGVVVLGTGQISNPVNNTLSSTGLPLLAPMWDQMRVTDGSGGRCVPSSGQYATIGTSPNRIFVMEYVNMGFFGGGQSGLIPASCQIRLYEGSNKIEYWYETTNGFAQPCSPSGMWGSAYNTSASIGIASGNAFISVTPGFPASTSSSNVNDYVDFYNRPIYAGTLYTFCPISLTGHPEQGGTTGMLSGDTLLMGKTMSLFAPTTFMPFTVAMTCPTSESFSIPFSYTLSGANADNYTITPASGNLTGAGSTPTITFTPKALGPRYATLTVRFGAETRTYTLAAIGTPRTVWTPDMAEGGSANLTSGDTLMRNIKVPNFSSGTFSPLSITVGGPPAPDAQISFSVNDPNGLFSLVSPPSVSVPVGGTVTPVIQFTPVLKVGWQEATFTVNAEGEIRTYLLRAFASGSGGYFYADGKPLLPSLALFRNEYGCVGTGNITIPITVESIGDEPLIITGQDAFQTETTIRPGTAPYELLRDEEGLLIPSPDYFFSDASGQPVDMPLTIAPLSTQTLYLTFSPHRVNSRRSRAFFETNGTNYFGLDTNAQQVLGNVNFEMVGYGIGAVLSNVEKTGLPNNVVFPVTEVRATETLTGYIYNAGECDMLITANEFRLVSGDVAEFEIVEAFPGRTPNGDGKYVIAPGDTTSFTVEFTPSRSGSRLASLRLLSNDSSAVSDGVSERGNHYIDLYGVGKAGLEIRPVRLSPAVIDGPTATGVATLENNSGEIITVTNIRILGSTEITEDPARPWMSTSFNIIPGKDVDLSLLLTPTPGSAPGMRTATLEVTLSNGEIALADITGLAGTRSVVAVPTSMFQGVRVPVGNIARQYLAVSNNGTLPIRIMSMTVNGANRLDYRVSPVVRSVIEPGTTEFFEVTYTPALLGASSATIEIVTNSTNGTPIGTHTVTLGGEGASAKLEGSDPSGSTETPGESPAIRLNIGGDYAAMMASGTSLWQSTPNPTSGRVEIRYALPVAQPASIELYDVDGRVVRTFVDGTAGSGEHVVTADVSGLPSGRYYYMLRTSEGTLTLALDVVK